jgi:YD repeat-containing protein
VAKHPVSRIYFAQELTMRIRDLAAAVVLLSLTQVCAIADVSLKNGNYFTGNKDMILPGGFEPTIERVYNSKTSSKGLFGYGWGNEYEVYVEVGGDGGVIVHEYGGGADNRFDSPAMTAAELDQAADQIVAVARSQGDVTGDEGLSDYRARLLTDAAFRTDEWRKYVDKKALQPRVLPVGTILTSDRFSHQTVQVLRTGYQRVLENGRTELFGKDGKLRQVLNKQGNYLAFVYDVPGQITLRDDQGRSIVLFKNDHGLVMRIEASNGKTCSYQYNNRDELVYAKDTGGGESRYEYDPNGRHNLTRIKNSEGKVTELTYYPYDQFENVKSVLDDTDGTLTDYTYAIDKANKQHYTVTVTESGQAGNDGKREITSTSTYEYINAKKPTGEEYIAKFITVVDGNRTATTYNPDGMPIQIEQGGETTSFAYDSRNHVTQKTTTTEVTNLTYDDVCSKVASVKVTSRVDNKVTEDGHFIYDGKCNLVAASSPEKSVKLQYDAKGRISEDDDESGIKIAFEYNANSKPIKISVLEHKDKDGKIVPLQYISVAYTDDGVIGKVEAVPPGKQAALEVTSAFQNLLDIIRPAGVNLSF